MKKLLFFVVLLASFLTTRTLTNTSYVYADILPTNCSAGSTDFGCLSKNDRAYCRVIVGNPAGYSAADFEKQNQRSKEPRCGGKPEATSATVKNTHYCSRLVYKCGATKDVFNATWFYVGLFGTVATELALLLLIAKRFKLSPLKKLLGISIPLNLATNTLLTLALVTISKKTESSTLYFGAVAVMEIAVIVIEAFIYSKMTANKYKTMLLVSLALNVSSIIVGLLVGALLNA
jgi:hypothetical protein